MRVESPVRLAVPAPSGSKGFFQGSHRAATPEHTWERIRPLLAAAGITRVGELTRLDTVGIPVAQAVRPGSRSAAVTLGAGLTLAVARVGAAMASLELWHAEHVQSAPYWSALGAVRANLGYNVHGLPLRQPSLLNDGMVLDWVAATLLPSGRPTLVPRACAEYDLVVRDEWSPPVFRATRVGLAAGNTTAEAVLHGLFEVLAQDAVATAAALPPEQRVTVDMGDVDSDDARRLLDRLSAAGVRITVSDITGGSGVPTFEVLAESGGLPPARGAACHLDRAVALCRALSLAARERLALLAGVRDDIPLMPPPAVHDYVPRASTALRAYAEIPSLSTASFAGDIAEISDRLHRCGAGPALVVDLARQGMGLPVARVLVPGLRQPSGG
jgi:ribosomal protein S12 methylthiotransferase accessory factor